MRLIDQLRPVRRSVFSGMALCCVAATIGCGGSEEPTTTDAGNSAAVSSTPSAPTVVNEPALGSVVWPDFGLIRGQEHAKEAAWISAAGGHNLLML